ncbi:hypothetical protein FOA52_006566 [Chlamydomonas sp. UWO 241]|nr:hypothetical protein FOA52_006566 [Chlamydomonas sp. UWO 241]
MWNDEEDLVPSGATEPSQRSNVSSSSHGHLPTSASQQQQQQLPSSSQLLPSSSHSQQQQPPTLSDDEDEHMLLDLVDSGFEDAMDDLFPGAYGALFDLDLLSEDAIAPLLDSGSPSAALSAARWSAVDRAARAPLFDSNSPSALSAARAGDCERARVAFAKPPGGTAGRASVDAAGLRSKLKMTRSKSGVTKRASADLESGGSAAALMRSVQSFAALDTLITRSDDLPTRERRERARAPCVDSTEGGGSAAALVRSVQSFAALDTLHH